jgi:cell division protein FtsB
MLKGSQKAKYDNCVIKFLVKLLIIITLASMSAGCGRQEIGKLRAENQALKSEVASLEQEITKLKETPGTLESLVLQLKRLNDNLEKKVTRAR